MVTVSDFLFEHAVTITNAAAVRRISERRQRVEETCRQSAETAVSERGIRFLVLYYIDVNAQFFQCIFKNFICSEVNHIVAESTSHQKFHRQIINHLRVLLIIFLLACQPLVHNRIRIGNRLKDLLVRRLLQCFPVKCLYIVKHASLKHLRIELHRFLLHLSASFKSHYFQRGNNTFSLFRHTAAYSSWKLLQATFSSAATLFRYSAASSPQEVAVSNFQLSGDAFPPLSLL